VFALAYLLGIELMPRIRNWKDLTFFRPHKEATYSYIEPLFGDVIDWKLIETHWQDLMRVVLSIRAGKIMPSILLRKLGTYSRKNRLYQAFRELGRVVRTIFLLQYISDRGLRRIITASTNQVEAFQGFLDWVFFGKDGVIVVKCDRFFLFSFLCQTNLQFNGCGDVIGGDRLFFVLVFNITHNVTKQKPL
jgi:TnpA family transposase